VQELPAKRLSAIGSPNMPPENSSSVALRRLSVMKLSSIKSNAAIPSHQSTHFETFLDAAETVSGTPYVFWESAGFGDFA
jgi:hypothetical protein